VSKISNVNEIKIQSNVLLADLFGVFEDAGVTHDYSYESGELSVLLGERWVMFYVDKRVMEDMAKDNEAFEDAQRIAEGQWNQ